MSDLTEQNAILKRALEFCANTTRMPTSSLPLKDLQQRLDRIETVAKGALRDAEQA